MLLAGRFPSSSLTCPDESSTLLSTYIRILVSGDPTLTILCLFSEPFILVLNPHSSSMSSFEYFVNMYHISSARQVLPSTCCYHQRFIICFLLLALALVSIFLKLKVKDVIWGRCNYFESCMWNNKMIFYSSIKKAFLSPVGKGICIFKMKLLEHRFK